MITKYVHACKSTSSTERKVAEQVLSWKLKHTYNMKIKIKKLIDL